MRTVREGFTDHVMEGLFLESRDNEEKSAVCCGV